ncbi:MAG: ATP-dependent protease La [Gammaproteobacteria bacterium]|nr:ATP-dependent protease La [Gammaproteobacteria bacterium]
MPNRTEVFYLHEQISAIQKKLDLNHEKNQYQKDSSGLRKLIDEANLSFEAKLEAYREYERLISIPASTPEYSMIRTYLEWLLSLPWNQLTGSQIDVQHARKILDEDHYNLDKIKDRIIEYLAVRKLREERSIAKNVRCIDTTSQVPIPTAQISAPDTSPNVKLETPTDLCASEPILCLVGPPGVGKTSLGHSIARALGRKFVRISLGGIHDVAEIRGQRRTSFGALPGRIIQSLKRAGVRDPVLMLDELDKLGADWRGNPSSALLEVLDPAQNHCFVDHYLSVPFDLSQVLFIVTANNLYDIPDPLLDRMELLHLSGYTDDEKLQITQRYLIPKQRAAHGLKSDEIIFKPEAISSIIHGYTREAGVRCLDREIATSCRKAALRIVNRKTDTVVITPEVVKDFLGQLRYFEETAERTSRPGIATGLAWTSAGGELLFIEVTMMPSGNERLILTGMLGDVMRESAQAALSYVRSNLEALGVEKDALNDHAIHIHIPSGAIPKDGPSAGITIATALASLITKRNVHSYYAMTGEITLRGQVLPVGGIKEKILAAHRAKITTIILPTHNKHDLEDVPSELRKQLHFIFVDSMEAVLEQALEPPSSLPEECKKHQE